jgi:phosphoglycerate dehydrogenase-like enzyme
MYPNKIAVASRTFSNTPEGKKIAGATIDVYDKEPLSLDGVICTPHISGNSREAVLAMGMSAIEHLRWHFLPSNFI